MKSKLAFDILGQVTSSQQVTDNVTYNPQTYVYNLSGALIEEVYPSGRIVKNTLDVDGDLAMVQSSKSNVQGLKMYANAFTYTSAGAVLSLRLGNGKFENTTFNSRLQPIQIGLGSSATSQNLLKLNFEYGASATENNGNVTKQTITTPTVGNVAGFTAIQTYSYDSLNRLKSAEETIPNQVGWKQTFVYDRYGNRNFDTLNNNTTTLANGCPVAVCNPQANTSNNKLVGTTYDDAGNTKIDASNQSYVYDAENKMVKAKNASGATLGDYFYDGDGKRVKKIAPSTNETTIFVYDAGGKMVAEYSTVSASQEQAKINYLTNDHLGSTRITTDATGKVISRRDFMPFGEEIARAGNGTDLVRQKFTGYERDGETGLDYAKARMFGSGVGRFTSPDNFLNSTRPEKPASWNLYVYVLNNPLKYIDPNGELETDANGKIVLNKTGEESRTQTQVAINKAGEIKINGKTVFVKVTWSVEVGTVKTNDGKATIKAERSNGEKKVELVDAQGKTLSFDSKNVDANNQLSALQKSYDNSFDVKTNCHGTTFANGEIWINSNQVDTIIKHDGYEAITGNNKVAAGDAIIYSLDGSTKPDQVEHSATLNSDNTVRSKGGIANLEPSAFLRPGIPGGAWTNPNTKITVWRQTTNPKK